MAADKKYVELFWAEKYDKYREKIPIEKPNLPFQVVETVNKPRIKGGYATPLFPEDQWPENYPKDWKNLLLWGDNKLVMSSLIKQGWAGKINLIRKFINGRPINVRDEVGNVQYQIKKNRRVDDVWRISMLQPADHIENLRFQTQKPEALLKRIILASSNPGDIIADFFCGSGTTLAVAEKLGRRGIGSDLSTFAIQVTRKRLLDIHNSKNLMEDGR